MDVREKLVKICFREFCDIAGDGPCGCDGCPYGEYDPDNGGCFDEYKKDKIEKMENDMDKYQKEDNGVTIQEWIPVKDRLPTEDEDRNHRIIGVVNGYNGKIIFTDAEIFVRYCHAENAWWSDDYDIEGCTVEKFYVLPHPPKGE